MVKGGSLLISGVVLLAGVAAWLALSGAPGSEGSSAPTPSSVEIVAPVAGDEPARSHVSAATDDASQLELPAGEIRVVEADGSVAMARVYTTSEPTMPHASRRFVGWPGPDGVVVPENPDATLLTFLWAVAPGRLAGPVAVALEPGGQTLTLGPGSTIEVHVRRPDGTPVAGASCKAKPWRAHAVTDANGDAVLSGFPAASVEKVDARVIGSHGHASADVSLPTDGAPAHVELEIDTGAGPFVLVTISGDTTPADEVQVDIAGGELRARDYTVRGGDSPVLVSLRQRADAVVDLTARCLGYRTARHRAEDLADGTTTPIELRLVAGGVPVRGRVLNADGSPAAGAEVGTAAELLEYGSEVTDEDGWFDVQIEWIGARILALREREACSPAVTLDDNLDEIVLRLGTGAVLQGVVRDETSGRGVEKAEVRIAFGPGEHDHEWTATTDASGAYRVAGLPPETFVLPLIEGTPRAIPIEGQWKLTGGHHRSTPNPERLIADGHAYRIAGTEAITHDLTAIAQRGGECTFHVVLPPGTELPDHFSTEHFFRGTRGWGDRRGWERPEDGKPSFTLFLEEGTHVLRVTLPGPTLAQVMAPGHVTVPGLIGEGPEIVVSGDGPLPDVEIVMTPRRRVLAQLVDSDGAPVTLAGVRIRVAVSGPGGGRSRGEGITEENGVADVTNEGPAPGEVDAEKTFVIFTLDGEGVYGASPWGDEANLRVPGRDWARRMREESDEPWTVRVPIVAPPTATLRVVDPAGKPAAGVPVRWKRSFDSEWQTGVSDAGGAIALVLTDELEQFEFEATGEWVGGAESHHRNGTTNETTLRVDRRRTIRVRFVEPAGNALPDQWVIAFVPGVWTERATDENGCIDLDLAASDTTFQVRARGFWPPLNVAAPAGATEVDAVIEPLFPVTFRVVLPAERDRPDRVFVEVGTGRAIHGGFESIDVVPGKPVEAVIDLPRRAFPVRVYLNDPFFGGSAQLTGVEDEVTVRVERLALRTIVLQIKDDEDRPLAGLAVHAHTAASYRGALDEQLVTDADGRVTVQLPPIALDVIVDAADRDRAEWRFDPEAEIDGPVIVRLAPARQ